MEIVDQLIVGAGYVGRRMALQQPPPIRVLCLVGREASAARLRQEGLHASAWDLDGRTEAPCLPLAQTLYYLTPPPSTGEEDPRLERFLAACPAPKRLVYLSTTAVYGDTSGATVCEDSPVLPSSARGRRRAAAEAAVRRFATAAGIEWTVLRVPGIYGPERLPLERLARGEPVLAEADAGLTNRIHVDDLIDALQLAGRHPAAAGRIYNVSDGAPCSTSTHFRRVAELAGLPLPRQIPRAEAESQLSAAFLSYLDESRRLDVARIARELGYSPRYADPKEGIRASLAAQTNRATRS
jgi:nucleoside-diphosphate-sugar epimerase